MCFFDLLQDFLIDLNLHSPKLYKKPIAVVEIIMNQEKNNPKMEKKREWKLFIFLTVFLFPILATVSVFGYGFMVWMSNILFGLPGHS